MDAPDPSIVLQVQGLRKHYGTKVAVDGVSFEIRRGQILGLLGPNGAGKTTTLHMILGILEASAGYIRICGHDVVRDRTRALACTNFAAVYTALPGNLSVEQNLRVFGLLYEVPRLAQRIDELLAQFDLESLRHTRCGLLSSGESTRAALAKAMLNRPALLLLDEPTASLDPASAREVRDRLLALARGGQCAILWTSHNMHEVEAVCDRVLFLSHGRVLLEGGPRELPREHAAASLEELFIRIAREPLVQAQAAP